VLAVPCSYYAHPIEWDAFNFEYRGDHIREVMRNAGESPVHKGVGHI